MWERYTTFVQLRLKEEYGGTETAAAAADYGTKELVNCPYSFFCGKDDKDAGKFHCAYLVWRAYKEVGIDIDSDGGIAVTPNDIYNSPYFERVMVIGF